jgi:hypothetical protein
MKIPKMGSVRKELGRMKKNLRKQTGLSKSRRRKRRL